MGPALAYLLGNPYTRGMSTAYLITVVASLIVWGYIITTNIPVARSKGWSPDPITVIAMSVMIGPVALGWAILVLVRRLEIRR